MSNYDDFLKAKGGSNTAPKLSGVSAYTEAKNNQNTNKGYDYSNPQYEVARAKAQANFANMKSQYKAQEPPISTATATKTDKADNYAYSDNEVLKLHEETPNYNLFQRWFDKDKRNTYKAQQATLGQYNEIKQKQVNDAVSNGQLSMDVIRTALGENLVPAGDVGYDKSVLNYQRANERLKQLGLTAEQVEEWRFEQNKADLEAKAKEFDKSFPVASSVSSLLLNPIESTINVADKFTQYVQGKAMSEGTNETQTMRQNVSEDMNGVGKFLYNVGMSIGDMGVAMGAGLATGGGRLVASGLMGAEKAAEVMNEATERGLTPAQIINEGVASGVTTALTEMISMSKWEEIAKRGFTSTSVKEIAKVIWAGAFPEAIQEMAEDGADLVADLLIAGNKSEINQRTKELEANGEKNAAGKAALEWVKQTALDGLGGLISGGFFGAASGIAGGINPQINFNENENVNTESQQNVDNTDVKTEKVEPTANGVDNVLLAVYTQAKGEFENDRKISMGYDGTGSKGVLRGIRSNGELGSAGTESVSERGIYLPTDSVSVANTIKQGESIYTESERKDIQSRGLDTPAFYNASNNPVIFSQALETAKASNKYGAAVDSHTPEQMQEIISKGGKAFLVEDGTAGGAVEADGNLTAVFKDSSKNKTSKMGIYIALAGVKNGAVKGDCFGIFLVNTYSMAGFEPVARMPYSYGYNDAMDAQVREQLASGKINKEPDVYAIKLIDGYDYNTSIENFNNAKMWTQAELDALPLFEGENGYDEMLNYRDSLISGPTNNISGQIPALNQSAETNQKIKEFSKAKKKSKSKVMAEDIGLNPRTNAEVPTSAIPAVNPADWDASLEMYPGRFTTNTETKLVNEVGTEETKKVLNEEIKNIDNFVEKIPEKRSLEEARERYVNNEAFERELFETSKTLEDGVSTDIAMIIGEEARIKGEQTGDYSDFRKWIGQMAQKSHKVGQALQALAKYSRTSTGSMAQAEVLAESFTEMYMKQHKKTEKGCAKLAGALKLIGNDGSIVSEDANLTHEQMLQRVRTTLNEESSSINEIFNDADVEYMARLVERGYSADELAKQIERRIATDHWAMSDEDVKTVVDLFNEADRVGIKSRKAQEFLDRAYAIEAQYIGGRTLMEKLNMFRYFSMLANLKTHIRNIFGNKSFGAVTNLKDTVAYVIENEYAKRNPEYERQYSLINKKADASLLEACAEDFEQNGYADATDSSKFNDRTNIENARKLPKLMEWNSKALEMEDVNAIKRKYTRSLAEYLKVNGKDASILNSNDDADIAFVEKAREHAVAEAKEATFHEDNAIASALSMFSRKMRESGTFGGTAVEMVIESMFPFKKTPANVLKSGVEYSPLGALKLFSEVKNKAGAAEYINTISKSLTGSAIFALGIALAKMGLLKGSNDDEVDDTLGDQEYSLNFGDFSYTVDWLAPAALPLFAGVEMYKAFEGDNNFWDAFSSITEPVIELSMLQGLKNTLKSIGYDMQYDPNNFVADLALNFATGYASQFVPTALGQVARTIDDTRRSTYSDKEGVVGTLDYQLEKMQNKIPGLSFTNEAYIDNFGNEQRNGDIVSKALGFDSNNPWMLPLRLMYQMASPGYASNSKRNDITAELERVSDATGSNLIPALADKKYNGEKVDEKTYEKMQTYKGQTTMSALKILTSDSGYKKLSNENKKQAIRDVENFVNALMKEKYVNYNLAEVSTYKKAYNIYKSDGLKAVVKYYIERNSK